MSSMILGARTGAIARRGANDVDDEYCTGWCTNDYARWIIAAIIIACVVGLSILLWFYSIRRATGVWALTAWRARQRVLDDGAASRDAEAGGNFAGRRRHTRRHHRRAFEADADPVPEYHATPGDGDAGHYDADGNYMAYEPPPYEPPKAMLRVSSQETDAQDLYELGELGSRRTVSVSEEFEPIDPRRLNRPR